MKSASKVFFPLLLISLTCFCAVKINYSYLSNKENVQIILKTNFLKDSLIQNFSDSSEKLILELSSINNEINKLNLSKDSVDNLIGKYLNQRQKLDSEINIVYNKIISFNVETIHIKDKSENIRIKDIYDSICLKLFIIRNSDSLYDSKFHLLNSQTLLSDLLVKFANGNKDENLIYKNIYSDLHLMNDLYQKKISITHNLFEFYNIKNQIEKEFITKQSIKLNVEQKVKIKLNPLYQKISENGLNGFHRFEFNGIQYRCFVIGSNEKNRVVRIHSAVQKGLKPLSYTWTNLKKKKPIFIMNAGMYNEDGSPVGLFINEGKIEKKLDVNNQRISDNFHLYPNGVFFIDNNGNFNVTATPEFNLRYNEENPDNIRFATQSGPMLLINGNYHKAFVFQSQNKNIRNGIGIIDNTDSNIMVMLISDGPVNFYNFTSIFKYIFNCKNALYMDGAISKMYVKEDNIESGDLGGNLGPVITVSQK